MSNSLFSLDIAQQPGPTAAPDFQIVTYSELRTATNSAMSVDLTSARSVFLDNHGGDVLLVELSTGTTVFTFLLDAHEEKQFTAPVPLAGLTITDLSHGGTAPFIGPMIGETSTMFLAPGETTTDPLDPAVATTGYVAVTTSDLPFELAGYYRSRPHAMLADAFKATLYGTNHPIPVQLFGAGGAFPDPLAVYEYINVLSGAQEMAKTPTVFQSVNGTLSAGGDIAAWTPSGHKFRVLGGWLASTTAMFVGLEDGSSAQTFATVYCPSGGQAAPIAFVGNGYVSTTTDNRLLLHGLANAPIYGTIFGTEE